MFTGKCEYSQCLLESVNILYVYWKVFFPLRCLRFHSDASPLQALRAAPVVSGLRGRGGGRVPGGAHGVQRAARALRAGGAAAGGAAAGGAAVGPRQPPAAGGPPPSAAAAGPAAAEAGPGG